MKHVPNRSRAFTMAEVMAAFAVTALAGTALLQLLLSTRTTVRASAERRLATEIAQGALERARVMPPERTDGIVADGESVELALPPAASRLEEARLTVSTEDWRGHAGQLASGSAGARLNAGQLASGSAGARLNAGQLASGSAGARLNAGQLASGSAGARLNAGQLASGSAGARLNAGLRHVRVQVEWRSSRGGRQKVVREGLVSDAHVQ